MDGIKEMEGKKVYIETNSKRKYTGIIKSIDEELQFINLIDKYKESIWIAFKELKILQEEKW